MLSLERSCLAAVSMPSRVCHDILSGTGKESQVGRGRCIVTVSERSRNQLKTNE
jgi:hypothetical protein